MSGDVNAAAETTYVMAAQLGRHLRVHELNGALTLCGFWVEISEGWEVFQTRRVNVTCKSCAKKGAPRAER